MITDKCFCPFQTVELANVKHLEVFFDETYDVGTMADTEVEVDDGKTVRETIHQRK